MVGGRYRLAVAASEYKQIFRYDHRVNSLQSEILITEKLLINNSGLAELV